jgi:RNA polymerase sigma-70 factor (ECF subfamily)
MPRLVDLQRPFTPACGQQCAEFKTVSPEIKPAIKRVVSAFTLIPMETLAPESVDSRRFAAWVHDHGAAVRGYLRGIVGRLDWLDDLVQEVFCRAWQGRGGYEERGHARAYLLQIADRAACDRFRRAKAETTLGDEVWEVRERPHQASNPLQNVASAEAAGQLDAALDQLTTIQKRALLLRYFGELTFNEIAATLGCPLNTALSHCHRGLQALRTYFESGGDLSGE